MLTIIDYFYYDYILHTTLKSFIDNTTPPTKIPKILSLHLKQLDSTLTQKLKLTKILSILCTNECKNMVVCCRLDIINKIGRCILIDCEELCDFLLRYYVVVGKVKNAFVSDNVYYVHVKDFKRRMKSEYLRMVDEGILEDISVSNVKDGNENNNKKLKNLNGNGFKSNKCPKFKVGGVLFNEVFISMLKREIKCIIDKLDVPFLCTITEDKIKDINRKCFNKTSGGKRMKRSKDNSLI